MSQTIDTDPEVDDSTVSAVTNRRKDTQVGTFQRQDTSFSRLGYGDEDVDDAEDTEGREEGRA